MEDIVSRASKLLGITPKKLFVRIISAKGMSNAEEVATMRFEQWMKTKAIPAYISEFCYAVLGEKKQSTPEIIRNRKKL